MRTKARVLAAAVAGVIGLSLAVPAATADDPAGPAARQAQQAQQATEPATRSAGDCPDVTRPDGAIVRSKPVVWTTEPMIQAAKQRVADRQEPFYSSWVKTKEHADEALELADRLQPPYQGPNEHTYSMRGRSQSKYARSLALAYRITGEQQYLEGVRRLLNGWARDAIEHPYPDPPKGFAAWPASDKAHGSGMRIGRVISIFGDAYAMVWNDLSAAERADVDEWMRLMVDPICETQRIWRQDQINDAPPPYASKQYFNNHLTGQMLGLATVGFVTHDEAIIRHAIDDPENKRNLEVLIDGVIVVEGDRLYRKDPTYAEGRPAALTGESYDRYRSRKGKGMFYSLLNVRFLLLISEMAHNNDEATDYYEYVAPGGENLELSFERYSPWYVTGEASSVNPGYYDHEQESGMKRIVDEISSWELALRHYPDNDQIRDALAARDRVNFDDETWGWSAPLTHGVPLD